jgi:hypothetical protein
MGLGGTQLMGSIIYTLVKERHWFSIVCIYRRTQLIWTLGVQVTVLLVMDDLRGVLRDCIQRIIYVSIRLMASMKGT